MTYHQPLTESDIEVRRLIEELSHVVAGHEATVAGPAVLAMFAWMVAFVSGATDVESYLKILDDAHDVCVRHGCVLVPCRAH